MKAIWNNIDLDEIKDDCREFVCSKAQEIVSDANITDDWDLDCLQDDLNRLLVICRKVDRCKGVKSIKRVMSRRYPAKEIKRLIS